QEPFTAIVVIRSRGTWTGSRQTVLACGAVTRNKSCRILVERRPHVDNVVSDVRCGGHPVRTELLLDAQVPLLRVHRLMMQGEGVVRSPVAERPRRGAHVRIWISAGEVRPWILKARGTQL